MDTHVNIGSHNSYALQRAILIYGPANNQFAFATVHEIERANTNEATPTLGVARLLTTDFIRELLKGLGKNTLLEFLPENVLARNEFITAWWVPTHAERVMFFHENSELAHITGKKFPTPALVFKIAGGQLSVRALGDSARPGRDTILLHAPFWNVYLDGKVCHGSARMPHETSLGNLPEWEKAFFGSNFSHTIRDEMCLHPGGVTGLWKELGERMFALPRFPPSYLKPCGSTLEEFITHV